jgi:nitric oxide reductase NorD protein
VQRLRVEELVRLRARAEGDSLDLDAAIRALSDLRAGVSPDGRVYRLVARARRDLSVLVLLDLSRSTNDPVPGTGTTLLDLAREATALLADAMASLGDDFAIHGFWSNTRRQVDYFRVKDFGRDYDEAARSRLAGLTGDYSTRMGCALRRAGSLLARRPGHARLVLLVTDGAPSDVDAHDPRYLVQDARHAVHELRRRGMQVHALTLDPRADQYVSRVFGAGHFTVLDRIARLPEKLPQLYLRLTG